MAKNKREKLLAILALVIFTLKVVCNVVFYRNSVRAFATYLVDLSPTGSPLLLCRVSFVMPYSLISVLYCVASTFLSKSDNSIIESKFFIAFSCSCMFEVAFVCIWSYSLMVPAFIFICATCFCQYATLYEAFTGLFNAMKREEIRVYTIWYHRMIVQSALIFDCAWNCVLTILILVVVLCYGIGLSSFHASAVGVAIYTVGLLIWFLLQNIIIEKYVRFIGTEYVAFSIALTCLLTSSQISGRLLPIALLSVMSLVLILLFMRMFVIICLETRRNIREQLYTVVEI